MSNPITARLFTFIVGGLWILLVITDRTAPFIVPSSTYYFRAWEYVRGQHGYPRTNLQFEKNNAHGDLSNIMGVSAYKAPRDILFTVDKDGMRNTSDISSKGKVMIVGQSFMAGAGNTDNETLASQLSEELDSPVYTYAPANMSKLLQKLPAMGTPKVIVWGMVERNLTGGNSEIQTLLNQDCNTATTGNSTIAAVKTFAKIILLEPTTYVRKSLVHKIGKRIYNELYFALWEMPAAKNIHIIDNPMPFIFLAKGVRIAQMDSEKRQMNKVTTAIVNAKQCLDEKGIKLIVLLIPDKEHIYNSWLPGDQQSSVSENPLLELIKELQDKQINAVDIISLYKESDGLLYWPDDTHWNPLGIDIAAKAIAKHVR